MRGNSWQSPDVTDSGYINRSDWTNVHMGSVNLNYDNLVGTFSVGETITEATSGNTGIVMSDSGTVLVLSGVTGTGIFIDDREITGGTSGATADVNGATKNVDTNFHHGLGAPLSNITVKVIISTDGTDANSFGHLQVDCSTGTIWNRGIKIFAIDNNNLKIQTANGGLRDMADDGTVNTIDTEDYYIKIIAYKLR